jgi:hypothetical protein
VPAVSDVPYLLDRKMTSLVGVESPRAGQGEERK